MTTGRNEVRELHATIEALTGRRPVSNDPRHLRRRLAMLRDARQLPSTELFGDYTISVNALLGADRCAIVAAMAGGSVSFSDVVRRAVDEYAVKQGFGAHVERAKRKARGMP